MIYFFSSINCITIWGSANNKIFRWRLSSKVTLPIRLFLLELSNLLAWLSWIEQDQYSVNLNDAYLYTKG